MDGANKERPNTQSDYENERRFSKTDDNFEPEEALEGAIDKRKFLMKRLFGDARSTNTL